MYAQPVNAYLNTKEVRDALHIPDDVGTWDLCADDPFDYTPSIDGSIDIYVALKDKYRILKYSGDTDGAIPATGTQQWIAELNWPVKKEWHAFSYNG